MKIAIVAIIILMLIALIFMGVNKIKRAVNSQLRSIRRASSLMGGVNVLDSISEATEIKRNTPKSLSGGDSMFLNDILQDFPEFNISNAHSEIQKCIRDIHKFKKEELSTVYDEAVCSFCEKIHSDYPKGLTKVNVHKSVISGYSKELTSATITFQCSYEFVYQNIKHQMKAELKYVYSHEGETDAIRCPHCGGPIDNFGVKVCGYCGALIQLDLDNAWKVVNISNI